VLAGGRGRRHSWRAGRRRGRAADGRSVVRAIAAVFAFVTAVVIVLEQRQPLALVLGLGRPLEHGEYLPEQLAVLGRLPEPALHRAGVVVDAEPAVVAVRYRAQERTGEERLGLRALVARLVRKARRRRRFCLGILARGATALCRPSLRLQPFVVAAVVAVRRVAVKRRELPRHLQFLVQRYALVLAVFVTVVAVVDVVVDRRHHWRERVVLLLDLQKCLVFVHQYPVRVVLRIVLPQRLLREIETKINSENT